MSNGKGSKARPLSISYDKYSENWDNIFKNKNGDMLDLKTNITGSCGDSLIFKSPRKNSSHYKFIKNDAK